MIYRSTNEVARLPGVGICRLARAVLEGRIAPPAKSPGGACLWTRSDIERASWTLRRRNSSDVLPAKGGDS